MWLSWCGVQPLFSLVSLSSSMSPLSQMMSVSQTQRITFAPRLPMASGPRSFDENSRKAAKEEKIKSAALSALVSADPPWESLRDHNTSHKTAGARPVVWKGPASHWSERVLNWRRERVEGKERFLIYAGWMRVSAVKPIELKQEWWSGRWYVGIEEEGGRWLVIMWSISATPAPLSPTPEGSRPCCVNHSPPMDPLKSDRNKRQACVLTLPCIHLRLYPFDLNSACLSKERIIFLITFGCLYCKMLCKMLLTNLV